MSTYYPKRRTKEERQTATNELIANANAECGCTHHDWLTCLAEREHTTPFNAWITFATSTKSEQYYGKCACLCHQDANHQQVDEFQWRRNTKRLVVEA